MNKLEKKVNELIRYQNKRQPRLPFYSIEGKHKKEDAIKIYTLHPNGKKSTSAWVHYNGDFYLTGRDSVVGNLFENTSEELIHAYDVRPPPGKKIPAKSLSKKLKSVTSSSSESSSLSSSEEKVLKKTKTISKVPFAPVKSSLSKKLKPVTPSSSESSSLSSSEEKVLKKTKTISKVSDTPVKKFEVRKSPIQESKSLSKEFDYESNSLSEKFDYESEEDADVEAFVSKLIQVHSILFPNKNPLKKLVTKKSTYVYSKLGKTRTIFCSIRDNKVFDRNRNYFGEVNSSIILQLLVDM